MTGKHITFSCVIQDKPPVLSLQNLIVRDIANQERGMFLISDSLPPEMYEFHAASKEDKNVWIRHIQRTVSKWAPTHANTLFSPPEIEIEGVEPWEM